MKEKRFAAIILAGGLSTRMKQFKPLLPLGDATVVDFAISTFSGLGISVFLVVGHHREEITSALKKREITIIFNPDYQKGMFSSVQAGVRRLNDDYQAFFILPVDVPLVSPVTVNRLIEAGTSNPDKIFYPIYKGKRGHPTLISSGFINEILAWEKDGGLKAVLNIHKESAIEVPVGDKYILFDIDTPEDYKELKKYYLDYGQTLKFTK